MKRKDADTKSTASDAELVVMRVLWEYGPSTVHEVVARVAKEVAKMRVGDPMDEATEIGAIISAE